MTKLELLSALDHINDDGRVAIRLQDGTILNVGEYQFMKRTPGVWQDDELHLNVVDV